MQFKVLLSAIYNNCPHFVVITTTFNVLLLLNLLASYFLYIALINKEGIHPLHAILGITFE